MTTRHKNPQYNLRMPDDLKNRLKSEADERGVSLNAEILLRLEQSLGEQTGVALSGLSKEDFKAEIRKHVLDDVVSVFREVIEEAIIEATPEKEELNDSY